MNPIKVETLILNRGCRTPGVPDGCIQRIRIRFNFKKILTGSDLSRRRIPLMTADSGIPGPILWLTACSHGDEVGGIVIIQEIFKKIKTRRFLKKGRIYAFPLMNPIGFETASRRITYSEEDLNRSFPGNVRGSLGERIANIIFTTIVDTRPDLVVDLHTDWIRSIPYALIDPIPSSGNGQTARSIRRYALETGFLTIMDTDHIPASLSSTLQDHHIPALTLELGESYVINEKNITYGVKAVENILALLGMIDPTMAGPSYPLSDRFQRRVLTYTAKPFSSTSGIVRFLAKPGETVPSGRPFAKIYNVFGKLQETMRTNSEVIVLGHIDNSVAFPGMPVMAFGKV